MGSLHRRKSTVWHQLYMVWLYSLGRMRVFYLFKWLLHAFAPLRGRGGGVSTLWYIPRCCTFLQGSQINFDKSWRSVRWMNNFKNHIPKCRLWWNCSVRLPLSQLRQSFSLPQGEKTGRCLVSCLCSYRGWRGKPFQQGEIYMWVSLGLLLLLDRVWQEGVGIGSSGAHAVCLGQLPNIQLQISEGANEIIQAKYQ